jgi:molybdate transport system ATP-binding protein
MDEPVSALDLEARRRILAYLKRIQQQFRIPIVYVSHSISEMIYLTQKIYVIDGGERVTYGSPLETLLEKPVWNAISPAELRNIFDLPVREFKMEDNLAILDFDGVPLNVAYYDRQIRPNLRIEIKAADIIVGKTAPAGLSARNIIPGILKRVVEIGGNTVLYVTIQKYVCLAEITHSALKQLELKENDRLYLIMKARSINVLE